MTSPIALWCHRCALDGIRVPQRRLFWRRARVPFATWDVACQWTRWCLLTCPHPSCCTPSPANIRKSALLIKTSLLMITIAFSVHKRSYDACELLNAGETVTSPYCSSPANKKNPFYASVHWLFLSCWMYLVSTFVNYQGWLMKTKKASAVPTDRADHFLSNDETFRLQTNFGTELAQFCCLPLCNKNALFFENSHFLARSATEPKIFRDGELD